ncbi:hypothetical protein IFM89_030557 [Coptis chinensis]|uniref:Alcohol dehydrogenase-like N-terminal domain-containing protein n=1 Tax=Coptis chinensis TaxID=261450 RepID=A0A835HNH5_9MAGN|nr:hypothetical protein IFM89_030557 [Coptis chinensis]
MHAHLCRREISTAFLDMAGKLMHAVRFDGYGGGAAALKHVEVLVPRPQKDEVLLKIDATSLNAIDWSIQKGMLRLILPRSDMDNLFYGWIDEYDLCGVPRSSSKSRATDVAGDVVEVGLGVTTLSVGDKVVAMLRHSVSAYLK